jgi:hypothetical protein
MLKAWRITLAQLENGTIKGFLSVYSNEVITPNPGPNGLVGATIQAPKGFHIGTTKDFVLDYYQGMSDPAPDKIEVLLELEVNQNDLQSPEMTERWDWPCGTEAITSQAKIVSITPLPPQK